MIVDPIYKVKTKGVKITKKFHWYEDCGKSTKVFLNLEKRHAMRPVVVVITAAQLQSTKPELRLCTGSNPACGMSEIRNGEDL